jgi:hypothetical protein
LLADFVDTLRRQRLSAVRHFEREDGCGEQERARGELSAALDAFRHTTWRHNRLVGLTAVYYAMGRWAESDQAMRQLKTEAAAEDPYEVAEGRAYRGEFEEARKWLERAGRQKNVDVVVAAVKGDPAFARYTGDPRYRAWLRKMNLPD